MINLLNFASSCPTPNRLFDLFPAWNSFLPQIPDANGSCVPQIQHLTDIWLIVVAIIEILLRLASVAAVAIIIYGGILYTTSQGSPEQTSKAKSAIVNALVGLAIAISASVIIAYIASRF